MSDRNGVKVGRLSPVQEEWSEWSGGHRSRMYAKANSAPARFSAAKGFRFIAVCRVGPACSFSHKLDDRSEFA